MLILLFSHVVTLLFCYKRTLRYLHALQQDEYALGRFFKWFVSNKAFDTRGSIIALVFIVSCLFSPWIWLDYLLTFIGSAVLFTAYIWEHDPREKGKILLKMTPRASRIFGLTVFLVALHLMVMLSVFLSSNTAFHYVWLSYLIIIHFVLFYLVLSILILKPHEYYLQKQFVEEARRQIIKTSPRTIAITGSFGKSSVKNALGEIMQTTIGSTFWPTGGVNTLMGITKHIRENLSDYHENMVIEMAAYRKGSIAKLCQFTPPTAGIITAIGAMHLERFGSLEAIYQAKTELAKAIPVEGILVCNGDDPGARRASKEYPKKYSFLYGFDNKNDDLSCHISDLNFSENGTHFTLHWQGVSYVGYSQLLGRPAISNLMAVFTMSCALGADPNFVLAAIANIQPMNNRLSIEKNETQTFLMDAYNSNPLGFKAALEVLDNLAKGRKILITPGMIELGELQFQANKDIALEAAKVCDFILFVGDTNLSAFKHGLEEAKFPKEKFLIYAHRNDALADLKVISAKNDTILIENDLPDLYEGTPSF